MRSRPRFLVTSLVWALFCGPLLAADILKNNGFTTCLNNEDIKVETLNLSFDRDSNTVTFDVAGTSTRSQEVTAALVITAYGQEFEQEFDPCNEETKVEQLCPIPAGRFSAVGEQSIASEFVDRIPGIAFAIPNLEAFATLRLISKDGGDEIACLQSVVGNGKTIESPAASYAAAGIACAALIMSGISAAAASGHPGATTTSPSFGEVIGWFQSIAINGMLSVNYPPIYRSFTNNFAFSTGLVPWDQLQRSIDSFRNVTGGNLTESNVEFLRKATLIHESPETRTTAKRALSALLDLPMLAVRQITVNETVSDETEDAESGGGVNHVVQGIQGFVEQLMIPEANTFMTVLLIFALVITTIAVGILLLKLILELWALRGSFPKKLTNFRKHYWGFMGRTITNLIVILYGIWTLYCVFQFSRGDSWAAKVLAGVTLAIFTAVLVWFTFKIWRIARRYKKTHGDTSALYEDQETWRKYSLFYDHYKKSYWWIFVPLIIYMFSRGVIIGSADGRGMIQCGGQLIVEAILLILLLWARPYETRTAQWINIAIQVVRVLSVACILVFVHELGISQTTKTVTGMVLIVIQSTLTALLAILITVNAFILCCSKNPHERRHKDAEKAKRDADDLTPLDARNSLLESRADRRHQSIDAGRFNSQTPYEAYRDIPLPRPGHGHTQSTDRLLTSHNGDLIHMRNLSDSSTHSIHPDRRPTLPNVSRHI